MSNGVRSRKLRSQAFLGTTNPRRDAFDRAGKVRDPTLCPHRSTESTGAFNLVKARAREFTTEITEITEARGRREGLPIVAGTSRDLLRARSVLAWRSGPAWWTPPPADPLETPRSPDLLRKPSRKSLKPLARAREFTTEVRRSGVRDGLPMLASTKGSRRHADKSRRFQRRSADPPVSLSPP